MNRLSTLLTARGSLVTATVLALGAVLVSAIPVAAAESTTTSPEQFLFTVESQRGTTSAIRGSQTRDEIFTLRLTDLAPVTQFADRPYRDARLITPRSLVANWEAWFASDPPNAVLVYSRPGLPPGSMVVGLTKPTYNAKDRAITFTAFRERRQHDPSEKGKDWRRLTTPQEMSDVSLFIDDASADTKPPSVRGKCSWESFTTPGRINFTVDYTVTDDTKVGSVGSIVVVSPTNIGNLTPFTTQVTASSTTSRSFTALASMQWPSSQTKEGLILFLELTYAMDATGNKTTYNFPNCFS